MKPRRLISIIAVQICWSLAMQAQEVRYTYDAAGNRTGYEMEQQVEDTTVIQKITEAPQQGQLQEVFTVRVYPNPVSSILHVDLPDLPQGKTGTLELYSSMGNPAMSPKPLSQAQTIDLSGVLPGLYMVRVTAGKHIVVIKILKL